MLVAWWAIFAWTIFHLNKLKTTLQTTHILKITLPTGVELAWPGRSCYQIHCEKIKNSKPHSSGYRLQVHRLRAVPRFRRSITLDLDRWLFRAVKEPVYICSWFVHYMYSTLCSWIKIKIIDMTLKLHQADNNFRQTETENTTSPFLLFLG